MATRLRTVDKTVEPELVARLIGRIPGSNAREKGLVFTLLFVGVAGLAFRFWLMANSIGCDDANIWFEHAINVTRYGVRFNYEHQVGSQPFNHPPLMGYWAVLSLKASSSHQGFTQWMKVPGLVVEVLTAVLVWQIWAKHSVRAAALAFAGYGTCLTVIEVSGYHCNTDCAYAGLVLLAFYLLLERDSPFWAGLAMAAALNVKIMPILLVPPLLSQCRSWREFIRLSLGGACTLLPYLPFVLWGGTGQALYKTVVEYNSQQLEWGVYALLKYGAEHVLLARDLTRFTADYVANGRYYVVLAILVLSGLAFFRSRRFGYQVGAAGWALFLVLTPGFCVQYAVCVVPLLFAADIGRAAKYGLFAGLMLLFIYTGLMRFGLPLRGNVQTYPFPRISVVFGALAWGTLVGYLISTFKNLLPANR